MDIRSLIEPTQEQQGSLPPAASLPSEAISIQFAVDHKSGSSREAQRRKDNAEASRRYRERRSKEKHLMQIEDDLVGILRVQELQDTFVISPPNDILVNCQELFGPEKSIFTPQQVFIVIQKMSTTNEDYRTERHILLRIMQTRLCSPGIYETDEGRFIRLSIAFFRVFSLLGAEQFCPGLLKNEGNLVDIQDIGHGMWEIKVRFLGSQHVVSVQGSLLELTEQIKFKGTFSLPPPPKYLA